MSDNTPHESTFEERDDTAVNEAAESAEPRDDEQREGSPTTDADPGTELDNAHAQAAQLKDQLLRKVAEFENFKRRTREEKDMLMKYGAEGVLRDLLPVIDDFERSLAAGQERIDVETMSKGVEIIYGKLMRVLENRGLRPIDAAGKPFDVDFHDALMQLPFADVQPGTVIDVVEKGYMLHDKVIRHAKVTVSRELDTPRTEADA